MSAEHAVIAAEGTTAQQKPWTLMYQPAGGRHLLRLLIDGEEYDAASGFDIPDATEIGFAGGLKPGQFEYLLYGLVTSRIQVVRAESREGRWSEVESVALPSATGCDGSPLRTFVLLRPPIDDVSALVGLDKALQVVQRIAF